MSDAPVLSVVVPAYSEAETVRASVAALVTAADDVDGDVELIVVENRSFAGLVRASGVSYIEAPENLGFAGGVMHGIRQARGTWIATVNDDCVVDRQALGALLRAAAEADVGSVAGLLVFVQRPDVVNAAGIAVDELGVAQERLVGRPVAEAAEQADVFGASGAFALYRREMLDEVGGFDESFFAYLEDADLAWRARAAGWRCVYEPEARAVHAHSSALGHGSHSKHFLVGRNRVRMLAKNATAPQLRRRAGALMLYDLAYVLYAGVRHRTLAPAAGRIAGLREWRRYRAAGAGRRSAVTLSRPPGLIAALRRDAAYRLHSGGV